MSSCFVRGMVMDSTHGMREGPSDGAFFWAYSKTECHYTRFKFHEPEEPELIEDIYNKWLDSLNLCDPFLVTSWNYEYQVSPIPRPQEPVQ